jgi:hypothetical protein
MPFIIVMLQTQKGTACGDQTSEIHSRFATTAFRISDLTPLR